MNKLLFCLLMIMFSEIFVACATTSNISQLSGNQYHIDVQAGIPGIRTEMTKKFIETARGHCLNFNIISQQYVPNPNGTDHLIGVIECN